MNYYSLESCEKLINTYVNEYKGELMQVEEGCLGLGKLILHSAPNKKSFVIKEHFVNSWSSTHSVRAYNKLPKKYSINL